MEGSDQKFVTLGPLDLRSTGVYRCEVSAEGPSFASVSGEGRMTVVRKSSFHSFYPSTCLFKRKLEIETSRHACHALSHDHRDYPHLETNLSQETKPYSIFTSMVFIFNFTKTHTFTNSRKNAPNSSNSIKMLPVH